MAQQKLVEEGFDRPDHHVVIVLGTELQIRFGHSTSRGFVLLSGCETGLLWRGTPRVLKLFR